MPLPEAVTPLLNMLQEEVQMHANNGIIQETIKAIPTEDLHTMHSIMTKSSGRHSEERVLKAIHTGWQQIGAMEAVMARISNAKADMEKMLLSAYAQEFSNYKNGEATFDNDRFKAFIQSEIDKRAGAAEHAAVMPERRNCSVQ